MTAPRTILFGSTPRTIATAFVAFLVIVGGAFAVGFLGAPSVVGVENRFGGVTETTTTIETDLVVDNPNPIGVQLGGTTVNYTVAMNDIAMAGGTKEGLSVEQGNTSLHFTTRMRNGKIPGWWVSHIRNGERTRLEIDARVHSSLVGRTVTVPHSQEIETDIIGQFNSTRTRPVNANRPVVSDPILYINRTGAAWGAVTRSETPIDMRFVVYNPKPTPYTITEIGYEISMNGVDVGEGATEDPYVVPGGRERTIEATTAIRNRKLDEWWVSHLRRDQVTDLRIDFYVRVELPTGNTVEIPLDELAYTKRIETDFFGTKGDAGATDGSPSTRTPSPDASDGAGTDTPTPDGVLDTPPVIDNGTSTPTDDGGILGLRSPGRR